ncbi:hypothetical protein B0H10DRAFT_2166980 [Mycena sp. CBHHK59/15]|nr:hypothetical protein B0H10DRAFT_2166980 [Mycena sp. CBHHK59/15]
MADDGFDVAVNDIPSSADNLAKAVEEIQMVANTGVAKWASLIGTTVHGWDRLMNINARGTFLCYKYAGMHMISQGRGGRIIGAASLASKQAYSCSKFAVRGLTQLGSHGITVNAHASSAIDTELFDATALGRLRTATDVASLVSFLASKDSQFITGKLVSVNGGMYFD